MLRAICTTADFDVLYDTQASSCGIRKVSDIYRISDVNQEGNTNPACDRAGQARDENDASTIPETRHLPPGCLRSEENTADVDVNHL
jgi:hypothetical protein